MYRRPLSAWSMAIRGPARNIVLAAVVVFLLAVADFQLASLMNIPAWTVWMFDAQAGGLALSSSLSYAILPGTIEVAVLAPAVWILNGCEAAESTGTRLVRQPAWAGVLTWLYLIAALGVATILPASVLLLDASAGVAALGQNKTLWGELVVSMTYASCAAGSASSLPSD